MPTTSDIVKCSSCSVSAHHLDNAFAPQKGAGSSLHHVSHTLVDLSCDQQSVSITRMSFETDSKHNVVEGAILDVAMMVTGAILDIAMIVEGAILDVAIACQPNH